MKHDETTDKLPPARDSRGRLIAGRQSINPKGRPKKCERPMTTFEERIDRLMDEAGKLPEDEQMKRPDNGEKAERDDKGLFIKGGSGNVGRTPAEYGGRVTSPAQARKRISNRIGAVIDKMCDLAVAGDTSAARLIFDRYLPALKATSITVSDAANLPRMIIQGNVIDAVVKDEADGIEDAEVVEPIGDKMPSEPV